MKGKTRAYNNQWILQSERNLFRAFLNMLRISYSVKQRGEYIEIETVIERICGNLTLIKYDLSELQALFNDPRAKKIEV